MSSMRNAAKPKGRILKVRLGYNANSSSLAAAVSLLLLGSAAAVMAIQLVGAAMFSRPKSSGEPRPGAKHGA